MDLISLVIGHEEKTFLIVVFTTAGSAGASGGYEVCQHGVWSGSRAIKIPAAPGCWRHVSVLVNKLQQE